MATQERGWQGDPKTLWSEELKRLEKRCEQLEQALREIKAIYDRDEYGASACGDVDHYGAIDMAEIAEKALKEKDNAL